MTTTRKEEEEERKKKVRQDIDTYWMIDDHLQEYEKTLTYYEWYLPLNDGLYVRNVLRCLDGNPELYPVTDKLYEMLKIINKGFPREELVIIKREDLIDKCIDLGYGIVGMHKVVLDPTVLVLRKGFMIIVSSENIYRDWRKEYTLHTYVMRNIVTI